LASDEAVLDHLGDVLPSVGFSVRTLTVVLELELATLKVFCLSLYRSFFL
jgi:hypothetical protein